MKRTPLKRKTPLRSHSRKSRTKHGAYTRELREMVRARDHYKCQICGCQGTQIHHVITRGRYFSPYYTLDGVHDPRNLMLICGKCHRMIHDHADALEAVIKIQEARFGPLRREVI